MTDSPEGTLCRRFGDELIKLCKKNVKEYTREVGVRYTPDVYRIGNSLYAFRGREKRVRKWVAKGRLTNPDFPFVFAGIYEDQKLSESGCIILEENTPT